MKLKMHNLDTSARTVGNLYAISTLILLFIITAIGLLNEYLTYLWEKPIETNLPILTDDFAPVDYYINKAI